LEGQGGHQPLRLLLELMTYYYRREKIFAINSPTYSTKDDSSVTMPMPTKMRKMIPKM
jgi:hypothetical protein